FKRFAWDWLGQLSHARNTSADLCLPADSLELSKTKFLETILAASARSRGERQRHSHSVPSRAFDAPIFDSFPSSFTPGVIDLPQTISESRLLPVPTSVIGVVFL